MNIGQRKIWEAFQSKVDSLTNEQSAYILSLVSAILVFVFSKWLGGLYYLIPLGFLLCGLLIWGLGLTKLVIGSLLGKAIGSICLIAATTFNLSVASGAVNSALRVPVSPFGYTHTLVAILMTPVTASLLFTFLAFLLLPIAMISDSLKSKRPIFKHMLTLFIDKEGSDLSLPLLIGRMMAIVTLIAISISFIQNTQWYEKEVSSFAKWYAYNFEMEAYSHCKLSSKSRVVYLGGNDIVIGKPDGDTYQFTVGSCEK